MPCNLPGMPGSPDWPAVWMECDQEQLKHKIARYKEPARLTPDEETTRHINELVSGLEQQLQQQQ